MNLKEKKWKRAITQQILFRFFFKDHDTWDVSINYKDRVAMINWEKI